MNGLRIASLCSGYGGLEMAIQSVYGGEVAWHADPDPGASAILAHHWPTVPNLGDITAVDSVFSEWMQGIDPGHVTAVPGLSREDQLRAIGNGVVWRQAALGIRLAHNRAFATSATRMPAAEPATPAACPAA